jgi:hypothetical protein
MDSITTTWKTSMYVCVYSYSRSCSQKLHHTVGYACLRQPVISRCYKRVDRNRQGALDMRTATLFRGANIGAFPTAGRRTGWRTIGQSTTETSISSVCPLIRDCLALWHVVILPDIQAGWQAACCQHSRPRYCKYPVARYNDCCELDPIRVVRLSHEFFLIMFTLPISQAGHAKLHEHTTGLD